MSILIKGMAMPKNCNNCNFQAGGWCFARSSEPYFSDWCVSDVSERPPWCPLIELPPHGRLIDADALKAKQQEDADIFQNAFTLIEKSRRDEALNAVANIVNAPTIIESEGE